MPFLQLNVDLKQLHVLTYLLNKWLLSGMNLFEAIKKQTLNGYVNEEANEEDDIIKSKHYFKSNNLVNNYVKQWHFFLKTFIVNVFVKSKDIQ